MKDYYKLNYDEYLRARTMWELDGYITDSILNILSVEEIAMVFKKVLPKKELKEFIIFLEQK